MTFNELAERLLAHINRRINSGEFTERSLARVLRISQPHLHNLLKGARKLTVRSADQMMAKFGISILDLIPLEEIWDGLDTRNPGWLDLVAKRKPPERSAERDVASREPWRAKSRQS